MNQEPSAFRGKNLFQTIEWITSYVLLFTVMMIVFLGAFEILPIVGLIIFVYLLIFIALQQYAIRKNIEKYAGLEILDGWFDVEYDKGEDILLPLAKIDDFPAISPAAKLAVTNFVEEMGRRYRNLQQEEFVKKMGELEDKIGENDED